MTSYFSSDRSVMSAARSAPRLLDQMRERIRYLHYSLRTEEAYLFWVKRFVRFHGLRHPRDMGRKEMEAFLTGLAMVQKVSASTHRQALTPPIAAPHSGGLHLR